MAKQYYFRAYKQSGVPIVPIAGIKNAAIELLKSFSRCVVLVFTEDAFLSYRQIKWWKGRLLPALANDTGHSKAYWEAYLKLTIMPDAFPPTSLEVEGKEIVYLPSITNLTTKEMSDLMAGSVAHLKGDDLQEGQKCKFGDQFHWLTLPESSLRKD